MDPSSIRHRLHLNLLNTLCDIEDYERAQAIAAELSDDAAEKWLCITSFACDTITPTVNCPATDTDSAKALAQLYAKYNYDQCEKALLTLLECSNIAHLPMIKAEVLLTVAKCRHVFLFFLFFFVVVSVVCLFVVVVVYG